MGDGCRAQAAVSASSPSSVRMWQAVAFYLAGLGEGGALTALAVLDGGVVVVVGGRGAGVGLAGLIHRPAQHPGPCRDSRPGGPLRSEDQTVTSSPANRTALREEENRPRRPASRSSPAR